jgi:hypothetical protein
MTHTVLLLTGFNPDTQYGGGAIVRSLIERANPQGIRWFCLSKPLQPIPEKLKRVFVGYCSFRARGSRRLRLAMFWNWFYVRIWTKLAARWIMSAMRKAEADTLWVVLDYHVVPIAAELIKRRAARRFHFSIHDHPTDMARHHLKSAAFINAIDEGFALIKSATCTFDAVSEELLAAAGVAEHPHVLVTMGCQPKRCADKMRLAEKTGPLRIGFAGSYFPPSWARVLVEGLKRWSDTTGRRWEIHAFGAKVPLLMPAEINWRGFFPPDELKGELAEMSFLLLALDRSAMLTSLPTKLVSYLEVGRLILTMVPEGSVTARIVRQNRLGPVVTELTPQLVVKAIDDCLNWDIDAANRGRDDLLRERFCSDIIFRHFAGLVAPHLLDQTGR